MPLVIEDGSGVANANTFADLAYVKAYAAARGVALSDSDDIVSAEMVKATDYIESLANQFVGVQTSVLQPLSWPRSGVTYPDGTAFPTNAIPEKLKQAEAQLVIEQENGIELMPNFNGGFVKREKVDVIEIEYSERIGVSLQPWMPRVDALLSQLFYNSSSLSLRSVRV